MATTVEQVCNQALRRIGNEPPIGSIYEGSRAARIALELYGQTRDDLLKVQDWDFAERLTNLTAVTFSPPAGWPYAYAWPSDCLKVRLVSVSPAPTPNYDPRPALFTDLNVTTPSSQRIIVANVSPALLTYTGQITDPTTWDAGFTEALVEQLAVRFAEAMGMQPEAVAGRISIAGAAETDLAASQSSVPANVARQPIMPEQRRQ